MQTYIDIAEKKGIRLFPEGPCQFCGAATSRGIHECMEIFNLGFQWINYSDQANHYYRFLMVDAHTLQHPEVHGRWNNHFHLTRQHLMYHYKVNWQYNLSPLLSDCLNFYKAKNPDDILLPPEIKNRGLTTTTDIQFTTKNEIECKQMIVQWGLEVYKAWYRFHEKVDEIGRLFIHENKNRFQTRTQSSE